MTGAAPVNHLSLQAARPSRIASNRFESRELFNHERRVTSWNRSMSRSVTSHKLPMIQPLQSQYNYESKIQQLLGTSKFYKNKTSDMNHEVDDLYQFFFQRGSC